MSGWSLICDPDLPGWQILNGWFFLNVPQGSILGPMGLFCIALKYYGTKEREVKLQVDNCNAIWFFQYNNKITLIIWVDDSTYTGTAIAKEIPKV